MPTGRIGKNNSYLLFKFHISHANLKFNIIVWYFFIFLLNYWSFSPVLFGQVRMFVGEYTTILRCLFSPKIVTVSKYTEYSLKKKLATFAKRKNKFALSLV